MAADQPAINLTTHPHRLRDKAPAPNRPPPSALLTPEFIPVNALPALPVPSGSIYPQPRYHGVRVDRWVTSKATTEQAMQSAYDARDIDALVSAVFLHTSKLYLGRKSPYLEVGDQINTPLASAVVARVIRQLSWLPHERPLAPYDPARVPFTWWVNVQARSLHLSLVERHWRDKTATTDKERGLNFTDRIAGTSAISDDQAEALSAFLESLPAAQRALADECLAGQVAPEARHRFKTLLRRAADWGSKGAAVPATVCECYRCTKRSWSSTDAMQMVEDKGALRATLELFRGLPPRASRPVGWYVEPVRIGSFVDPWASEGRRHTKPTAAVNFQPIPAKLYAQIEGSARQ